MSESVHHNISAFVLLIQSIVVCIVAKCDSSNKMKENINKLVEK